MAEWIVPIHRLVSLHDPQIGDILYHGHSLIRVISTGKTKGNKTTFKFRVIGKVNIDRKFHKYAAEAGDKPLATKEGRDG